VDKDDDEEASSSSDAEGESNEPSHNERSGTRNRILHHIPFDITSMANLSYSRKSNNAAAEEDGDGDTTSTE
jgi:hypothetical protein